MNVSGARAGAVSAQQTIRASHRQSTMKGDDAFAAMAPAMPQPQQPSTKGVQSLSRAFEHAAASSSRISTNQSRTIQSSSSQQHQQLPAYRAAGTTSAAERRVSQMRHIDIHQRQSQQPPPHNHISDSLTTTNYSTPISMGGAIANIESSSVSVAGSSSYFQQSRQQQQHSSGSVTDIRSSERVASSSGGGMRSTHDPYHHQHQHQHQIDNSATSADSMHFHVPDSSAFDMSAVVQSPNGQYERCQIIDLDDSNYSVRFVPRQMGMHSVSVKHKGIDIPGSPFEFMVGPVPGGGASKIQTYGAGLYSALVNEVSRFEILTKEAGAGSLSVAIEGPTKAEIDFQDKKDGTCAISYVCSDPGQYQISIKFNDEHVPGSPFMAMVLDSAGGVGSSQPQMRLSSLADQGGQLNQAMTFTLDMVSGRSKSHLLDAYVVSPLGTREPCTLSQCGSEGFDRSSNSYSIKFTPSRSGLHWVHVLYAGRELPDSPFQVHVKGNVCDPRKVFASGQGLYGGEVNELCEFFIDTSQAGSGALAVTVDGPSKVHIECDEDDNAGGYRASFVPTLPGQYMITVKFAEVHVAGSPFQCRIAGGGTGGIYQHSRPLYSSVSNQHQTASSSVHESMSSGGIGGGLIRLDIPTHSMVRSSLPGSLGCSEGVTAYGAGLSQAFIGEDTHFTVDTSNAKLNPSMLSVAIQGPRKPSRDIQVKRLGDSLYDISYTCAHPGNYTISVKWAEQHIEGSPFDVNVC